jgi:hypothetical protein
MVTSKMVPETAPIVNDDSSNPAGVVAAITAPATTPFPMAASRAAGIDTGGIGPAAIFFLD